MLLDEVNKMNKGKMDSDKKWFWIISGVIVGVMMLINLLRSGA